MTGHSTIEGFDQDKASSGLLCANGAGSASAQREVTAAQAAWQFQLHGHHHNCLVDGANALLGLVLRVRRLTDFDKVSELQQQVADDIARLNHELLEGGCEPATVVAYRYVLCTFIDEAVLGTDWGAHSVWSQQSLLSRFHNETWGGEKVFAILSRMRQDPSRHRDMLEFIFVCLCLGFEGRYKVMSNGREDCEQILSELHELLQTLATDASPFPLSAPLTHVTASCHRVRKSWPVWGSGLFVVVMAGVYSLYKIALNERITDVLGVLEQLPR
ncbi:type IVB secretion system protein IcmH/DotU [Marinobacter sp. X15-166B]|uniref:type IVB secretion system protein IcmH/DotU n=1 Tax=Marinobacter sp. X15-166B TaxID=1897620 RepID=UPI00085CB73E|nr:type IVB secretion system protein IcmH/DotU [Marinobacter sp. X15-166B]OEY65824.1 type IV secretion protein DotU [Marinobacter sp. X15-166B]